jgi:hypothetical protein
LAVSWLASAALSRDAVRVAASRLVVMGRRGGVSASRARTRATTPLRPKHSTVPSIGAPVGVVGGECDAGEGAGGQAPVVGGACGVFVGPAFGEVVDGGGERGQQWVGRGDEGGQGAVAVVPVVQVRGFVGEQYPAFGGGQGAQHAGRYDDPAVVFAAGGDGERPGVGLVEDDEAAGAGAEPPAGAPGAVQRIGAPRGREREGEGEREYGECGSGEFRGHG